MLANHVQWLRYQIAWTCHERGPRKDSEPHEEWNSDLLIPRSDAPPLTHRDSTVSEVHVCK